MPQPLNPSNATACLKPRSSVEQNCELTVTSSVLEPLRPGNVADDVTSGADTVADWYPLESADDPECTGRMTSDHFRTMRLFYNKTHIQISYAQFHTGIHCDFVEVCTRFSCSTGNQCDRIFETSTQNRQRLNSRSITFFNNLTKGHKIIALRNYITLKAPPGWLNGDCVVSPNYTFTAGIVIKALYNAIKIMSVCPPLENCMR